MADPKPRRFLFDAVTDPIVSPTIPLVHSIKFAFCGDDPMAFIHTSCILGCGRVKIVPVISRRTGHEEDAPPWIPLPLRESSIKQLQDDFGPPSALLIAAGMQHGVASLHIRDPYEFRIDFSDTYKIEDVMPQLAADLWTAWLKLFGEPPDITKKYETKHKFDLLSEVKLLWAKWRRDQTRKKHGLRGADLSDLEPDDVIVVDSLTDVDSNEV